MIDIEIASIVRLMPGYVYWKNADSIYLGSNQNLLELLGFKHPDEIVGISERDMPWAKINPAVAEHNIQADRYVIETGKVLITEEVIGLKNEEGLPIVVRSEKRPLLDKTGRIVGILGISLDITKQKRMEKTLVDFQFIIDSFPAYSYFTKQKKLKNLKLATNSILNSVPGYVYWKNLDSVYIGCNQDFLKIALVNKISDVMGKTDYTLPWGINPTVAAKFINDDKYVVNTGNSLVVEDNLVIKNSEGLTIIVRTEKKPFYDKKGNIIGILGIAVDITDQKEVERLKLENLRLESLSNKLLAEEYARFSKFMRQITHDIRSPLASLMMMTRLPDFQDVPEKLGILLRQAIARITDITDAIPTRAKEEKILMAKESMVEKESFLISTAIREILSEKRYEYQQFQIQFQYEIEDKETNFVFVQGSENAFKRMLSNLLNNAVEAYPEKKGVIKLKLESNTKFLTLRISDKGIGISPEVLQKLNEKVSITQGKESGSGIGYTQIWDSVEHMGAKLSIQSKVGQGTQIILKIPKAKKVLDWIMGYRLTLEPENILVILDDDDSIHYAWDLKILPFLKTHSNLVCEHFTEGEKVLHYIQSLSDEQKEKVLFLTDYELLKQNCNGLDILEACMPVKALLVTSHYASEQVINRACALQIKILPKELLSEIFVQVEPILEANRKVDFVLIEDDQMFAEAIISYAKSYGKHIEHYTKSDSFLQKISAYPKDTIILLDNQLIGSSLEGIALAEKLHQVGYQHLFLMSAGIFLSNELPPYLKIISKMEIEQILSL